MTDTTQTTRWEQYNEAGRTSFARGDHAQAEEAFQSAVAVAEQLGPDSLQLASSLSNLGQLRYQQRDHARAVELFSRSLAIREGALGSDHVSVAQSINNLAAVHVAQNDLDAAEPLLRRALAITEQQKGTLHPDLAVNLNNLAKVYFKRADHASAEPLLRRLLAIKQAAGRQHPEVATVLASLATLKQALGDHAGGASLWREALEIRELPGTPEGPRAAILDNLADCSLALGDRGEAIALRERALEIRERAMGSEHASVMAARARITALREVPAPAPVASPPDNEAPPTSEDGTVPAATAQLAQLESMTIAKSAAEDLWWDPNASPQQDAVFAAERPRAPKRRDPNERFAPASDPDGGLLLVATSVATLNALAPTPTAPTYAPPAPMPGRMSLESSLVPMPMPMPVPVAVPVPVPAATAPMVEREPARPALVQRDEPHSAAAAAAETRAPRKPNMSYSMEQPGGRGKLFAIGGAAIAAAALLFVVLGGKSATATQPEVPVAALSSSERVAAQAPAPAPAPATVAATTPDRTLPPAARTPAPSAPLPPPDEAPPAVTTAKRVVAIPQAIGPISMDGLTNDIEAKTRARVDEVTKVRVKPPTFKAPQP